MSKCLSGAADSHTTLGLLQAIHLSTTPFYDSPSYARLARSIPYAICITIYHS